MNLTIIGGYNSLRLSTRTIYIINCTFINNTGTNGGAISIGKGTHGSAFLNISSSTFINNTGTNGGAIYINWADAPGNNFHIYNSTFINNTGTSGGAISLASSSYSNVPKLTIMDSTFINNTAGRGGAIYSTASSAQRITIPISNSIFISNTAEEGGAIYGSGKFSLTINSGNFSGNNATNGGVIYNNASTMTISNGNFSGNNATNGGVIYNNASTMTISNGNFSGNNATNGGVIYNVGNVTITGGSFTGDNATYGGVIYNNATVTISNGNFSGNNATNGGVIYNVGNVTISGVNFTGNTATNYGGAIYSTGILNITNFAFINNIGGIGGAIYNTGLGYINGGDFTGNHANNWGGGVYWTGLNGGLYNSKFFNNTVNCPIVNDQNNNYGGGTIYWSGTNGTVENCNVSLSLTYSGGAIYWNGINGTLVNCKLFNNSANTINTNGNNGISGIRVIGNGFTMINCTFIDNKSRVFTFYSEGKNLSIFNCSFINNTNNNAFLYNTNNAEGLNVVNSTFTNTYSNINNVADNCNIVNSTFFNISGTNGAGVYNTGNNLLIINSTFNAISTTGNGGAIYNNNVNISIIGSNFTNNTANRGVIYNNGGIVSFSGSTFNNNNEAFTTTNGNFSFVSEDTDFYNNTYAIVFLFNNLNYIVNWNYASFDGNLYIIRLSGNNSNYTILSDFNNPGANYNGVIFDKNTYNNTIIDSIISGFNITGNSTGVIVEGGNNSVINSNITYNSVGLLINGNDTLIRGCSVINNTYGIIIGNLARNTIVNYNRLVNPISLVDNGTNTDASYNWWGNNNITKYYQNNSGTLIIIDWYVITLTANDVSVIFNNGTLLYRGPDSLTLEYVFALFNDGGFGEIDYLPDFIIDLIIMYTNNVDPTAIIISNSSRRFNGSYKPTIYMPSYFRMSTNFDLENIYYLVKYAPSVNSTISVSDNIQTGHDIIINGSLINSVGEPVYNVVLNISIITPYGIFDDFVINFAEGWNYVFTPKVVGNYTVVVSWDGDFDHAEFTNSTIFNVPKTQPILDVTAVDTFYGVESNLTINATLSNGRPIDNDYYNVTINNTVYTVYFINGIGVINLGMLPTGIYNFNVAFIGSEDKYNESNTTVTFKVSSIIPIITVNNIGTVVFGDIFTVSGFVTGVGVTPTGYVNISIGNYTNTIVSLNPDGSFNITLNSSDIGIPANNTHIVNVQYNGDINYNASEIKQIAFNVSKTIPILIVNPVVNVTFGDNVIVNGTLLGVGGVIPTNASKFDDLVLLINGKLYNVTFVGDGNWFVVFNSTGMGSAGTYNFSVIYYGDDNYTDTIIISSVTIDKASPVVIVDSVSSVIYGDDFIVSGRIVNVTANATGTVNVTIGNFTRTISLNGSGEWNITINITDVGNVSYYNVVVIYSGDINYTSQNNVSMFVNLTKANTSVIVNPVNNITFGSNFTVSGTVTSDFGTVVTGNVSVIIGNQTHTGIVNGGFWSVSFNSTEVGDANTTYNIHVTYNGDTNHLTYLNDTLLLNINPFTPSIIVNPINNLIFGENIIINGSILGITGITPQLTVNITIGNYSTLANINNTDGFWNLVLNSTAIGSAGTYTVKVNYNGNVNYTNTNTVSSVLVNHATPVIAVNNVDNQTYGNTFNVTGTITGVGIIPTGTVTIHFNNGENITISLDTLGGWSYTFNTTDHSFFTDGLGFYTVNVTYNGDNNYTHALNDTISFNIFQTSPVLIVNPVNDVVYGNNVTVTGNVVGVGSVPTGNVTIHFNNGNAVIVDLDNTGYWSYTFKTTNSSAFDNGAGSYTVNVTYDGDNNYTPAFNDKLSFSITPAHPEVFVSRVGDVNYGKSIIVSGNVSGIVGGSFPTGFVTVKVSGKSWNVPLVNGKWNITIKSSSIGIGDHVLSVGYSGNVNYTNAVSKNSSFSVLAVDIQKQEFSKIISTDKVGKKIVKYSYLIRNFGKLTGSKVFKFNINAAYNLVSFVGSNNVKYSFDKKTRILKVFVNSLDYDKVVKISFKIKRKLNVWNGRDTVVQKHIYKNRYHWLVSNSYVINIPKTYSLVKVRKSRNTNYVFDKKQNKFVFKASNLNLKKIFNSSSLLKKKNK
ncbi:beta strand repeat-containing protein [Methanobrevibacter arboriphilus]|uniref:beta strand repeat-containing protein n=1 Tax=Methanobrevibacter arboriphilus TaxID=39441 RepID=UPI000A669964|nr:Ig-like domain-containing protein [Methanobrevibacter arboriphilus]